jgi:phosphoribosylanthranilate isomerase
MTWVKICGTTNLADAEAAVAAGADALGFIFAESPRRIAPADARAIIERLPSGVEKIGVFVDEDFERVWQIVDQSGLTGVQLHGHETPRGVRRMLEFRSVDRPFEPQPKIFKAIPVGGDPYAGSRYVNGGEQMLAGVLLDTGGGSAPGGTGVAFDWKKNEEFVYQLGQRFRLILAGGLDPRNVGEAIATLHPWGVDVVSGVEREPGKKDPEKVKAFVKAAKCAQ